MSTVDPRHERLEELIAMDAVAGLEPDDRRDLAAMLAEHGPDCAGCAELFASYGEAAATLAFSLEPRQPSGGAEARLIAAARARDLETPSDAEGAAAARPSLSLIASDDDATDAGRRAVATEPGRRRERRIGRWIAAAAVAAALAVGMVAGFVAAPRAPNGTTDFLSFAAQPGTRFAAFPTTNGESLTVAYRPGETQAWVFGSGLTKPDGGRTYELWWGPEGSPLGQMHAAGTFVPIHGDVVAPVTIGSSDPGTVLGVTVEPPGGSPEPTTQPVFVTSV